MKFMPKIIIAILFALTVGCVAQQRNVQLQNRFDKDEAEQAMKPGKNKILGNAFVRQMGGGVVTCAGNAVELIPITKYSNERILAIYGNTGEGFIDVYNMKNITFTPDDYDYHTLRKRTTCDSQGNFDFDNVADGEYFITTGAVWHVGSNPQGGGLMKRIFVNGGETKKIVMSR